MWETKWSTSADFSLPLNLDAMWPATSYHCALSPYQNELSLSSKIKPSFPKRYPYQLSCHNNKNIKQYTYRCILGTAITIQYITASQGSVFLLPSSQNLYTQRIQASMTFTNISFGFNVFLFLFKVQNFGTITHLFPYQELTVPLYLLKAPLPLWKTLTPCSSLNTASLL